MSFSSGLKVFAEKLADDLMGSFLNTIIYLSLPLLRLFMLNFCHYNYKVSWCEPPWADLLGTLGTWTWIFVSFPRLGEFSAIIQISLFFFSFWGPVMWMLVSLMLPPEISNYLCFFIIIFLFGLVDFHISVFQVADSFFCIL